MFEMSQNHAQVFWEVLGDRVMNEEEVGVGLWGRHSGCRDRRDEGVSDLGIQASKGY